MINNYKDKKACLSIWQVKLTGKGVIFRPSSNQQERRRALSIRESCQCISSVNFDLIQRKRCKVKICSPTMFICFFTSVNALLLLLLLLLLLCRADEKNSFRLLDVFSCMFFSRGINLSSKLTIVFFRELLNFVVYCLELVHLSF